MLPHNLVQVYALLDLFELFEGDKALVACCDYAQVEDHLITFPSVAPDVATRGWNTELPRSFDPGVLLATVSPGRQGIPGFFDVTSGHESDHLVQSRVSGHSHAPLEVRRAFLASLQLHASCDRVRETLEVCKKLFQSFFRIVLGPSEVFGCHVILCIRFCNNSKKRIHSI